MRVLEFIARLFRREEAPEPGSEVEELWVAALDGEARGRFREILGEGYAARYAASSLELSLDRPGLFAWTEAPLYRHPDFVLEGEFELSAAGPYAACGFLFRCQDEGNFYAALVSNRGYFRLDVVFNGTPRSLVAWTECPAPPGDSFSLRVIARGGHFTIVIDDTWAAEAVDDSFRSGHPAFAAQRYAMDGAVAGPALARLSSCFVESRPLEVETWYYRWNYYIVPDPAARRRLAETFFSMGEHLAAAVQLRKIERRRALDATELFLKAELSLRLGLEEEAQAALDACLALEPGRADAAEEKANLLYLRGRSAELRDWLSSLLPTMPGNARLAGLSGHARFALGDFTGAAAEYRRAAELDPGQALFRMNEARAWDQAKKRPEAAEAYLAAAGLFFGQEADDDLSLALHRLSSLRPRAPEVKALRAKLLFRQGRKTEAGKLIAELISAGSEDSALHYLQGLLHSSSGRREEALAAFTRAVELEPAYPLYAFRLAESLFLLGRDARAAVARALELAPADGWTLNLAGQEALSRGDRESARAWLESARAALPGSPEPAANLAELESGEGRLEAALAALAPFPEDAACRNQAGNAWAESAWRAGGSAPAAGASDPSGFPAEREASTEARRELLESAAREYERACAFDPSKPVYQENLAAVYIELERYSDAQERVRRALDLGGGARSCLLAGNLGLVFGDRSRAEAAYRVGLEAAPGDPSLLMALGRCYLGARNRKKAEEVLKRLEGADPARAARLAEELIEATTEGLSCSSCGRAWRVPRDLPPQNASSIRAMPPDDSPAGACPKCGKIYCISCRKARLAESRFTCPDCGEALKLSDNRLRWLVREHLRRSPA